MFKISQAGTVVIGLIRHFYDVEANTYSHNFPHDEIEAIDEEKARNFLKAMSIPDEATQIIVDEARCLAKKYSDHILTVNINEPDNSIAIMTNTIDHVRNLKTRLLGHPENFEINGTKVTLVNDFEIDEEELEHRGLGGIELTLAEMEYSSLQFPYVNSLLDWFDVLAQYADENARTS